MQTFLDTLSAKMDEQRLPALLIGGHAVIALGVARATYDVDLLIPRDAADAWKETLQLLGLKLYHDSGNFLQFESPKDWPLPPVDLMLVDRETFEKLDQQHSPAVGKLFSPSLAGLIALKLHSARQRTGNDRERDLTDIEALIASHHLNLQEGEIADIIQRYGDAEAIKRLTSA